MKDRVGEAGAVELCSPFLLSPDGLLGLNPNFHIPGFEPMHVRAPFLAVQDVITGSFIYRCGHREAGFYTLTHKPSVAVNQ